MKRKGHQITPEKTVLTDDYKYLIGIYRNDTYGETCLRVTKYQISGTFVGHFVLVPSDHHVLFEIVKYYNEFMKNTSKEEK
jgi:hypothetical protein